MQPADLYLNSSLLGKKLNESKAEYGDPNQMAQMCQKIWIYSVQLQEISHISNGVENVCNCCVPDF